MAQYASLLGEEMGLRAYAHFVEIVELTPIPPGVTASDHREALQDLRQRLKYYAEQSPLIDMGSVIRMVVDRISKARVLPDVVLDPPRSTHGRLQPPSSKKTNATIAARRKHGQGLLDNLEKPIPEEVTRLLDSAMLQDLDIVKVSGALERGKRLSSCHLTLQSGPTTFTPRSIPSIFFGSPGALSRRWIRASSCWRGFSVGPCAVAQLQRRGPCSVSIVTHISAQCHVCRGGFLLLRRCSRSGNGG